MSTEYKVLSRKHDPEHGGLIITEGSGRFDIDFFTRETETTIAYGLDVEELCEAGLRFLQVALYNCADAEKLRAWLRERVREVDFSGTKTPFPR